MVAHNFNEVAHPVHKAKKVTLHIKRAHAVMSLSIMHLQIDVKQHNVSANQN